MEAEMRTQLRRQAAAHMDHVQDVLKVQEQELRADAEQVRLDVGCQCTRLCPDVCICVSVSGGQIHPRQYLDFYP